MRIGNNPNRGRPANSLTPIVLTCVTHLPNFEGYHKRRLEVVLTCLKTMKENAGGTHTLMVWDNDSCDLARQAIKDEINPDIFIESTNVGKTEARYRMAKMLDWDTVMAYSDDDMYFYPNWLDPQVELLTHFPDVAVVTGYPVRTQFRWGVTHTHAWGRVYGKMQEGRFMPKKWEKDFCASIGRDYSWHEENTKNDKDYIVEYNGLKAYATAHHCQFIGRAGTIVDGSILDGEAMGDEKKHDEKFDTLGLRLATTERLVRHIGNVIDDPLRVEVGII